MASSQTLAQLRTRARRRANFDGAGSSDAITDAEVTEHINVGCQEVFDELVMAAGHEHFARFVDVATVAGTTDYALPADYFLSIRLSKKSGATWRRMRAWQWEDYERLMNAGDGGIEDNVRFRVVDQSLVLLPSPASAFTVRHWYTYTFTRLEADGDTFDGINGWEEYVVLHAAIAMLHKREELPQAAALAAELTRFRRRIEILADHRSREPDRIRDTRRDWAGYLSARETGIRSHYDD